MFEDENINAVQLSQFHPTQVEAKCQLVEEQAGEREQELRNRISSAEEQRVLAENQVKDLKENIFELEDQVEQHRAVNCHANQAVLDMESTFIQPPPLRNAYWEYWLQVKAVNNFIVVDLAKKLEEQKAEAERQLKVLTRKLKARLGVLKLRCSCSADYCPRLTLAWS